MKHNDFSVSLSLLRCRLEQYIFEPETLYAILNRKLYYTNYIESLPEDIQSDNPLIVTPPTRPSEGCCNCIYRHLISKEPHAYLTNYYNIAIAKNVNIFLNKIRSRYGYSSRPQNMSSSSFKLKSQFSERSYRRQSKHITANTIINNNDYPVSPNKRNSIKKTKFASPPSVITTTTSFTSSTTPNNTNSSGKTVTPNTNTTPNAVNTNGKGKKRNSQRNSDSFIRLSNKTGIEEPSTNNNPYNCGYKTSRALIYLVPSNSCRFNNVSLSPKHNKIGLSKNLSNDDLGEDEVEGEKK